VKILVSKHLGRNDLDAGGGLVGRGLGVVGHAGVVTLVVLLKTLDLQPGGGNVLAGAATAGGHNLVVVTREGESLVGGVGEHPAHVGGGVAHGLALQNHVAVGVVAHVLGLGDDPGLVVAGSVLGNLQLVVSLAGGGGGELAQVGVRLVVSAAQDHVKLALAHGTGGGRVAALEAVAALLVLLAGHSLELSTDVTAPTLILDDSSETGRGHLLVTGRGVAHSARRLGHSTGHQGGHDTHNNLQLQHGDFFLYFLFPKKERMNQTGTHSSSTTVRMICLQPEWW